MTAASISGDATSASEIRDRVRDAAARHRALRIVAGGSWLDANRPVHADAQLDVGAHAGILEYEPGDLTLTARAGTALEDIARVTGENGQWLALDPYGDPTRATLGATIATASYGPLAHHFGTPRDATLGVEIVTGAGDIVRGGGRVVKNVAGFDLTRLFTGSWGTLGVLTEATVRLRALPAVQMTLAIEVGAAAPDLEGARAALRALPFVPLAAQFLDAPAARSLAASDGGTVLLVRLGGNEDAVRAQLEQLRDVGDARAVEPELWSRLRVMEPEQAAVLRFSRQPSAFTSTWRDATALAAQCPGGYSHGDPTRGVARVVVPLRDASSQATLRAAVDVPFEGTRINERLPAELWQSLKPPTMRGPLDRRIKATFDPHNILNPGIFGELQ